MSKRLTILSTQFWINKGFSEEEAKNKVSDIQCKNSKKVKNYFNPRKIESWINKGFSEEEAKIKVKEIYRKSSNLCIEFWINKGFSEEEAKIKVKEVQSNNSRKRKEYKKEDQNTNIEYYIKRNYPNALESLKERQSTRSLTKYIEKYGDIKGIEKYNQSIEKFKYSAWYSKSKEEQIELTLKRIKSNNFYSKSSILFFEQLINDLNIPNKKIYWKNNEFFIKYENGIYFYDFCIPDLNIIIEFNGSKFHPNKNKMSCIEFNNWHQLLSNKSASEVYEKDQHKNNLAITNNFDLFIVWDTDNMESKIIELKNELINRIIKKRNY